MERQELQALLASKEEELQGAQKEAVALKAAHDKAQSDLAAALESKAIAEGQAAQALAATDALRVRVCAQLLTQVNEQRTQDAHKVLFAKDAPEATAPDADASAEMERLERLLLADKILIEREARNFGTDFDVQAERNKLMTQPPAALAFALDQIRATAIPKPEPPMGRGVPLMAEGDASRATPSPGASDEFETFSIEEQVALASGQADYR